MKQATAPLAALRTYAEAALRAHGIPRDAARSAVAVALSGHVRDVPGYGLSCLSRLVARVHHHGKPSRDLKLTSSSRGVVSSLHAPYAVGQHGATLLTEAVADGAASHGVGVGVADLPDIGYGGYYTELLASKSLVGVVMCAGSNNAIWCSVPRRVYDPDSHPHLRTPAALDDDPPFVNLDIRTDPIDLLPGAAGFAPHQAISLSLLVELMAALGGGRGREAFAGADEKRPSSGYFFAALDPSIVCADEEFVFPFEGVGAGEHGFYAAVEALVEELRNEADGNGLLPGELGYRRELAASKAGAVELTAEDAEVLLWVGQGLPTGESVDVPSFLEGAV